MIQSSEGTFGNASMLMASEVLPNGSGVDPLLSLQFLAIRLDPPEELVHTGITSGVLKLIKFNLGNGLLSLSHLALIDTDIDGGAHVLPLPFLGRQPHRF